MYKHVKLHDKLQEASDTLQDLWQVFQEYEVALKRQHRNDTLDTHNALIETASELLARHSYDDIQLATWFAVIKVLANMSP